MSFTRTLYTSHANTACHFISLFNPFVLDFYSFNKLETHSNIYLSNSIIGNCDHKKKQHRNNFLLLTSQKRIALWIWHWLKITFFFRYFHHIELIESIIVDCLNRNNVAFWQIRQNNSRRRRNETIPTFARNAPHKSRTICVVFPTVEDIIL